MIFSKWFCKSISGWVRAGLLAVVLLGMLILPADIMQAGTPDYVGTRSGTTWSQMTAAADWTGGGWHTSVALSDGSIVLMGGYGSTRKK
jgi:hypothetical protein